MKKSAKIVVIVLFLILEFAWAAWPRLSVHGPILDEPYRRAERKAALYAWVMQKTPETKAAYDAEVELLDSHMMIRTVAVLIAGLAINAVGIYLFWRYAPKRTAA